MSRRLWNKNIFLSPLPPRIWHYSRLPIPRTLANSNLALTWTNIPFLSCHFLYNFTLDNSNLFQFPLKVRVIGSRLYLFQSSPYFLKYLQTAQRFRFEFGELWAQNRFIRSSFFFGFWSKVFLRTSLSLVREKVLRVLLLPRPSRQAGNFHLLGQRLRVAFWELCLRPQSLAVESRS